MLCNACGVKALYSSRSRIKYIEKAKAAKQQQGSKAPSSSHKQATHQDTWQSNKRRRLLPQEANDVDLTSAQAQTIKLKRHYSDNEQQIVRWTVTDRSIDDTRDFDQAVHAQAFIDECWLFISADKRYVITAVHDTPHSSCLVCCIFFDAHATVVVQSVLHCCLLRPYLVRAACASTLAALSMTVFSVLLCTLLQYAT